MWYRITCVSISRCLDTDKLGDKKAEYWSTQCLCAQVGWPWKWKSLSRVRVFATSWTIQSMEFSRPEYWRVAVTFSRGSSPPRDRTQASCIAGRFFTLWATRYDFGFTNYFFLLKYSWFTLLCWFCCTAKWFTCIHIYIYRLLLVLFSITVYHKILNIVLCALQ